MNVVQNVPSNMNTSKKSSKLNILDAQTLSRKKRSVILSIFLSMFIRDGKDKISRYIYQIGIG